MLVLKGWSERESLRQGNLTKDLKGVGEQALGLSGCRMFWEQATAKAKALRQDCA